MRWKGKNLLMSVDIFRWCRATHFGSAHFQRIAKYQNFVAGSNKYVCVSVNAANVNLYNDNMINCVIQAKNEKKEQISAVGFSVVCHQPIRNEFTASSEIASNSVVRQNEHRIPASSAICTL